MIRVLNALFDDRYGGPQKRAIDVGNALKLKDVETVLLFPQGDGNAVSIAKNNGLKAIRLPFTRMPKPKELIKILRWLLLLPRDISIIAKQIKYFDIDVVHVNGSFFLAPALAAKLTRRPLVWHLNDTIVTPHVAELFGTVVKWLAEEIVVAAEAVANHYSVSKHRHTVIYAPVNVELIRPKPKGRASDMSPLRVGLIANWNPLKGLEVFVEAAASIRKQMGTDVQFVIAGARLHSHADYAASIDQLVHQHGLEESFHSLGFVKDMSQFLHSLNVLVLSSWSEACPMAVLEGMAAGLPVVATDVGGVKELIGTDKGEKAGYVVSAGDSLQIAGRVLELLQHPELRHQMGKCGRETAEKCFSLQACASAHLDVYRDALGRSKQ